MVYGNALHDWYALNSDGVTEGVSISPQSGIKVSFIKFIFGEFIDSQTIK